MPRKRTGPTDMENKFIEAYIEHGDGVRAVIEAGYSERSAQVIASQLKRKLAVDINKGLNDKLRNGSAFMLGVVFNLAKESDSDDIKLKAAKDWLDRSGYKPIDRHADVTTQATAEENFNTLMDRIGEEAIRKLYPDMAKQYLDKEPAQVLSIVR